VHRPLCPELLSKSLAEYNYATMKATVNFRGFDQRNYGSLPDTIVYMLLLYNLDFSFDWFGLSAHASYRTASRVRVLET